MTTYYGVVEVNEAASQDIRTLNRAGVHATVDLENGMVCGLLTKSSTAGEGEVWTATQAVTGALANLWMVFSDEKVMSDGVYPNLNPNPRFHINKATKIFSAFKPQMHDIITLSAECVEGTKGANTYVVATDQKWKLQWASAAVSGLSLKLLGTNYMSIPDGGINTGRITSYQFEVVAIA